jgi:hypothetical protein
MIINNGLNATFVPVPNLKAPQERSCGAFDFMQKNQVELYPAWLCCQKI